MASARGVKAGESYVEVGLRSRIKQGANKVRRDLQRTGQDLVAIGGGIAAAMTAALSFPVKFASDAEETAAKFNTVFGDMADSMREFSKAQADALGTSQREMESMLSGLQDLLVPMGGAADESAEMAKELSALAVDLGSFNNLRTEQVFRDITAALTGSGETMKKYGSIVSATAVNQELLNRKLDPKTATAFEKAQAATAIIMRSTTAAQGDAIRTADGYANSVKRLRSSFEDFLSSAGKPFLDILARLAQGLTRWVKRLTDFVAAHEEYAKQAAAASIAAISFSSAIAGIGAASLIAARSMAILQTAMAFFGTTANGLTAPFRFMIRGLRNSRSSITALSEAFIALRIAAGGAGAATLPSFATALVGAVSAIASLTVGVGGLVALILAVFADWEKAFNGAKAIAMDLIDTVSVLVDAFVALFSGTSDANFGQTVVEAFKLLASQLGVTLLDTIWLIGETLVGAVMNIGKGLTLGFEAAIPGVKNALIRLVTEPLALLQDLAKGFGRILANIWEFIKNPRAALANIRDAAKESLKLVSAAKERKKATDAAADAAAKEAEEMKKVAAAAKTVADAFKAQTKELERRRDVLARGEDAVKKDELLAAGVSTVDIFNQKQILKEVEAGEVRNKGLQKYKELLQEILLTEKERERIALKAEGLTDSEIRDVQSKRDQKEFNDQRRDVISGLNVEKIREFGKSIVDLTGSVDAGAAKMREMIGKALSAGRITESDAKDLLANLPAFQNEEQDRLKTLREEIRQSNETEEQTLRREFVEDIKKINTAFGKDSDEAKDQRDLRKLRFDADKARLEDEKLSDTQDKFAVRGDTGSFSAFGAGINLGNAVADVQSKQLIRLSEIAKYAKQTAKKRGAAAFAP